MQRELLKDWEKAGKPSGHVFEEIGECLLAKGMMEEARPWFVKAWPLLKDVDWIQKSDPERLRRLERLARGEDGSSKQKD